MLHRGERVDFAPIPCSGPDKAELLPCFRELIPCSVAQGTLLQTTEFADVSRRVFAENS